MKPQIRLCPPRIDGKGGFTNIPGRYRNCEDRECPRFVPSPYVRCQDHRTDFATKDSVVSHYEPEEVEIIG